MCAVPANGHISPARHGNAYRAVCLVGFIMFAFGKHSHSNDMPEEQDPPVWTLAEFLIASPLLAFDAAFGPDEGKSPRIRDMAAELSKDSMRTAHINGIVAAMEEATPLLLVEWYGGGVEWESLLFTADEMVYLDFTGDGCQTKSIGLDVVMKEAIAEFCQGGAMRETGGLVGKFAYDTPLFLFNVFGEDAQMELNAKPMLFFGGRSPNDQINDDSIRVTSLKNELDAFMKRSGLRINIHASGA